MAGVLYNKHTSLSIQALIGDTGCMSPDPGSFVPTLVWVVTFAATALAASLGAIIAYHLYHFAMNKGVTVLAMSVYIAVSGALVLSLIGAASFI